MMGDAESIKDIVNQVAVQEATVVMMAFRDTHTRPKLSTMPDQYENEMQKTENFILEKLRWDVPDSYVELLNFQLLSN